MKLQDVILKAMAKKLIWIEAAEIAGMSVRNMQRKRQVYIDYGYNGLFDQRQGKRSIHRVPRETAEKVLALYQEQYFDLNVRHFHEKLSHEHQIQISYSWVKQALQGRLPQELRLAGITSLEAANCFLRERYIGQFNEKFTVKAAERGTAFRPSTRQDVDWVFSIQTERVVSKDNTVAIRDQWWQLEQSRWRHTLAGQAVTIHQHLDGRVSIRYGPHVVGRGKEAAEENQTPVSLSSLEIAGSNSHFPTASATTRPLSAKTKTKRVA